MDARFVALRNDVILIDEIVEVNVTDKYYNVGRIRFLKGSETSELWGQTIGKGRNTKHKVSINNLYRI